MSKQSSVEFLEIQLIKNGIITNRDLKQAKTMHREEHAQTWDKAIEKLEARGGNQVRAFVDFDDYYNQTFE
jgi:hypothetical protein